MEQAANSARDDGPQTPDGGPELRVHNSPSGPSCNARGDEGQTAYDDVECIGFIECRCPKCRACPQQQAAKIRLARMRERNRVQR